VIGAANKMKKTSEKGISILEALVSTAIIGIGFVAIFQMVQYSVRSIDISGERTKSTYLTGMLAEDLYSYKDEEKGSDKFMDIIEGSPWKLETCDKTDTSSIPLPDFTASNAYDNQIEKWNSRFSKNYIKCSGDSGATGSTKDKKKLNIFKICHSGCAVTLSQAHDTIYMGRSEVNMMGGGKTKILYFQVK
jgi:Tfp pilus assembly protein PilV|tara:strand:- start:2409 stop:2981 length:573 start_codon:yes stop_codon:yes gene_type:complete